MSDFPIDLSNFCCKVFLCLHDLLLILFGLVITIASIVGYEYVVSLNLTIDMSFLHKMLLVFGIFGSVCFLDGVLLI